MITIDPDTAETDRRILRHVNEALRGGAGGGRGAEGEWDLVGERDPVVQPAPRHLLFNEEVLVDLLQIKRFVDPNSNVMADHKGRKLFAVD